MEKEKEKEIDISCSHKIHCIFYESILNEMILIKIDSILTI